MGGPTRGQGGAFATPTDLAHVDSARLARYGGYSEAAENDLLGLMPSPDGSGLQILVDGLPDETLLAMDGVRFGSSERPVRVAFAPDARGEVAAVTLDPGTPRERVAPRVVPLPSTLAPVPDPDTALTTRIVAAIRAIGSGGAALADAPDVTPGAKRDFARGTGAQLANMGALTYVGEEDVAGRGIHRHDGEVARVRLYRYATPAGPRYLLAHLTAASAVTDYDVVER
jgi:hypothetical protein